MRRTFGQSLKRTARQMSRGMKRTDTQRRFTVLFEAACELEDSEPIADTSQWIIVGVPTEGSAREFSFDEFYKLIRPWVISRDESVQISDPAFCRFGAYDLTNQVIQMLLDSSVIVTAKAEFRLKTGDKHD